MQGENKVIGFQRSSAEVFAHAPSPSL